MSRRSIIMVVLAVAACRGTPANEPLEQRHAMTNDDAAEDPEWLLLHAAVSGGSSLESLGRLAEHYQKRNAWDEYSVIRVRMLASADPATDSIPAPGGPFPRIGVPRTTARPLTVLGHWWLNPWTLPELYEPVEVSPAELEAKLREQIPGDPHAARVEARIADALCAQLRFAIAIPIYERLLPENEELHGRLAAARRIVNGHR